MDKEQYDEYKASLDLPRSIDVLELSNIHDHTLDYGYTLSRDTYHVYIKDRTLHRVIYGHKGNLVDHISGGCLPVDSLRASKRSYPNCTDEDFAYMMRERDMELCFTTFNEEHRHKGIYCGSTYEELTK